MRLIWLSALFSVVLVAQTPEPYPGQKEHKEPPKGWFCSPDAKDDAHKCACKNMARSPEDPICSTVGAEEDDQCKVWCHVDHCGCKVLCDVD